MLKSRGRIPDSSLSDLKIDIGCDDELIQYYDRLSYLIEQCSWKILK